MNRFLCSLASLLVLTVPAMATGTLACRTDSGGTMYVQVGFVAVTSVVGVDIVTPGAHWSTYNVEAEQLAIAQAFVDDTTIRIDLTDPNMENIMARVRLFAARQGDDAAVAGILDMPGNGVYAMVCEDS